MTHYTLPIQIGIVLGGLFWALAVAFLMATLARGDDNSPKNKKP